MNARVALIGNPNCGKSTLFNALTASSQKVGNWPGVTVEYKQGHYDFESKIVEVIDLPGIYQLAPIMTQAIDERITCVYLLQQPIDLIVNVIDAAHLERHLYLTLQLLSLGIPVIVAVNMLDIASKRQLDINLATLQKKLGCPVVGLVASKKMGVEQLKKKILENASAKLSYSPITIFPEEIRSELKTLTTSLSQRSLSPFYLNWLALNLVQDPAFVDEHLIKKNRSDAKSLNKKLEISFGEDLDIVFADIFYSKAHAIVAATVVQNTQVTPLTARIDKVILHRFLGIPIFFAVMYSMFLFAINFGGAFQDFFDIGSEALFVQGITQVLHYFAAPNWMIAVFGVGIGRGINTTVTFIPVIGAMFFFLALLESSGYMARATVVIDRFMRLVGLPGKAFIPMIVGFGCNVPAILAARTLDSPRDRTLTILMSPFMSCSARLAIFAVFVAAFFPVGGQNIVFLLYLIGIFMALATGFILRKTLLQGDLTPMIMELPAYHIPQMKKIFRQTWQRLKSFIFRAGKIIVPVCMLISALNVINVDGSLSTKDSSPNSLLSSLGRVVTPFMEPMGIQKDNWPATVGLVTGILAKEVVVATLNTLYMANNKKDSQNSPSVTSQLGQAALSVPTNLAALTQAFTNPFVSAAPEDGLNRVYGVMYQRFAGPVAAFAYLLFILLYFPCISATAVMAQELNKKWTIFSVVWSTGIAYFAATSFYQVATFFQHPRQSLLWVTSIILLLSLILTLMRKYGINRAPENKEGVLEEKFSVIK